MYLIYISYCKVLDGFYDAAADDDDNNEYYEYDADVLSFISLLSFLFRSRKTIIMVIKINAKLNKNIGIK